MVKVNTHQTGVHQQIIFSTFSEQTRKGAIVKMCCFIALGFNLISEIAQGSSRQHGIMPNDITIDVNDTNCSQGFRI